MGAAAVVETDTRHTNAHAKLLQQGASHLDLMVSRWRNKEYSRMNFHDGLHIAIFAPVCFRLNGFIASSCLEVINDSTRSF